LQVHRSLARAVTVDNEVATKTRTLHTLTVSQHFKNQPNDRISKDKLDFNNWTDNYHIQSFLDLGQFIPLVFIP
jgi:hypothetical protein